MDYSKLPWKAAAVLLWLEKGEKPDASKHFKIDADLGPPSPNPEAWWELGQAIIYARTVDRDHRKLPWIKAAEIVLRPEDILGAYEFHKNHGHGHA